MFNYQIPNTIDHHQDNLCQKIWDSCCNFIQFERNSAPRSPSSMLDRQKPDVWLRGANIETGGGREGGGNVSLNGIVQPNAREN